MTVEKRIVCEIHPNERIRTWHTTRPMNPVGGICNRIECLSGHEPRSHEWGGQQATVETSPIAFALAKALSDIPGVLEAAVGQYEVRVELADAFDFDTDQVANKVVLAIRRHVYTMRAKVKVLEHANNKRALIERHRLPREDDDMY